MFPQSTENDKRISAKLKKLQHSCDDDDKLPPLDVSLHSTATEISGVTEVTLITTISEREKEMNKALACLEQPQEHPVDALLRSMHGGGPIKIDTIPRPTVTLQEYFGARVYSFARNVGLAQDQAETFTRKVASSMNSVSPPPPPSANATWSAKTQGRRKSRFAQFFQDRADTFARNIEHLGSMLQEKIDNNAAATATSAGAIEQDPSTTEEPGKIEQGSSQEGKEEPQKEPEMLEMEVESQGKEEETIAEKHQQSRQSSKEQ